MTHFLRSTAVTAGLAIFSMLFGAGNLMYPIKVGLNSGDMLLTGIIGFLFTAVLIPVIGLISIIHFNGNYQQFFTRIGTIPGRFLIAFCMAVLGPFYVMSRNVTVCYAMLKPFLPDVLTSFLFGIIFCSLTFLATYKESKILDLLGNLISPLLLISLAIIVVKGLLLPQALIPQTAAVWDIFAQQAILGYGHLDLLGTIFFGSIVLSILKSNMKHESNYDIKELSKTGLKAGLIGCFLLGLVYIGLALLGAYHGIGLESVNLAELFSIISFKILGKNGALVTATAVAMACFSTITALAIVFAEYFQRDVMRHKISYIQSLTAVIIVTFIVSCSGIDALLKYAEPIINTLYPLLMTLTLCNLAFTTLNFKPVKSPVLATLLFSLYINWPSYGIYLELFR
jgi:branched-chain amino acid:cation transporter, LIVCS family